jgi:hypothetical protein
MRRSLALFGGRMFGRLGFVVRPSGSLRRRGGNRPHPFAGLEEKAFLLFLG